MFNIAGSYVVVGIRQSGILPENTDRQWEMLQVPSDQGADEKGCLR